MIASAASRREEWGRGKGCCCLYTDSPMPGPSSSVLTWSRIADTAIQCSSENHYWLFTLSSMSYLQTLHCQIYFVLQVLTMFLPLILLMILPKLINTQDPEMQRVCSSLTLHLEHSVGLLWHTQQPWLGGLQGQGLLGWLHQWSQGQHWPTNWMTSINWTSGEYEEEKED